MTHRNQQGAHRPATGASIFSRLNDLLAQRRNDTTDGAPGLDLDQEIASLYSQLHQYIVTNNGEPVTPVRFGTSGWRGILGDDLFCRSVGQVTLAIISLYTDLEHDRSLATDLGVSSLAEAQKRGCVLGYDNRFDGETLATTIRDVLTTHGFTVHWAGEATTGTLSASVLIHKAAFSINLTPSHNPLEYGGLKFNAADAGPAAPELTNAITRRSRQLIAEQTSIRLAPTAELVRPIDALADWITLVREKSSVHGLNYHAIVNAAGQCDDLVLAVDCVHGASRIHIPRLLDRIPAQRLILLRSEADPTFGGIAPEPSSTNLRLAMDALAGRPEPLKLGMIIDPDADRIRFTDGSDEITMNQFGALAYHYLHETKKLKGPVAKTVATSNFANAIASDLGEEVFEPAVGFKNFKPVIGRALTMFEESDGITIIGHTPEKDAYIGLLLALDMVLTCRRNLGPLLLDLGRQYGHYFPDRDGVAVTKQGAELRDLLKQLHGYQPGKRVAVGKGHKTIAQVVTVDGYKMIFEDRSWLMIRPSGTEPKVRFYIEARKAEERPLLLAAAQQLLHEIGLV